MLRHLSRGVYYAPPPSLKKLPWQKRRCGGGFKRNIIKCLKRDKVFPPNELFMSHFLTIRDLFFMILFCK